MPIPKDLPDPQQDPSMAPQRSAPSAPAMAQPMPADATGADTGTADAGGAPDEGGADGAPDNGKPKLDKKVSEVLWNRVSELSQEDMAAFDRDINRELGLLLLKVVPELSMLILHTSQMQGPEMQDVRDMFDHDAQVAHIQAKLGGAAGPAAAAGPTPAPAQAPGPQVGAQSGGLRQF